MQKYPHIFNSFGMDDEDIRTLATNISNILANNQSLLTDTEEDDTYGEESFYSFD